MDRVVARVAAASDLTLQHSASRQTRFDVVLSRHVPGRTITPEGISPVAAIRQSAMSNLRASATIIVLRVPPRVPSRRWLELGWRSLRVA